MNALDELKLLPDRKENPYLKEWKDEGGRGTVFRESARSRVQL